MSTEANKKVALTYFEYITTNRLEEALDLLAEDVTQWIQGSQRVLTKADIRQLLTWELDTFEGIPKFTVVGTTCEGNRVAIECQMDAPMKNGKRYQNKYHVLAEVENGKLKRIMEYTDTAPARAAFSPDYLKIVLSYFEKIHANDLEGAMAMLTDDATLWLPGRGSMDKAAIRDLYTRAQGAFTGKPSFKVTGSTREGDRIAIECEMASDLKKGGRYENQYHMLFAFDGTKIKQIREYTDSAPAAKAFGG